MANKQRSGDRTRAILAIYASALAILLALAIGIFLVQDSGNLASRSARFNLGLGLISSAIFALIFSTLTTWVLNRNQRAITGEMLESNSNVVVTRIAQLEHVYMPIAHYPASDKFGEKYNIALMQSIESSPIYDFSGPSARYVAARLRLVRHCPQQIRISMIDPAIDSAVMRRAADREKWASSGSKTLAELEKELRHELIMTIVALFDFRSTCPVSIVYSLDLVVYRMELTDTNVFFSWYHGSESSGKEMPQAVEFGNQSLYYQVLRQDMTRRFEVLPKRVLFESRTSEADLQEHLRDLTGIRYTTSDLRELRAAYIENTKSFTAFMRRLGYGNQAKI